MNETYEVVGKSGLSPKSPYGMEPGSGWQGGHSHKAGMNHSG